MVSTRPGAFFTTATRARFEICARGCCATAASSPRTFMPDSQPSAQHERREDGGGRRIYHRSGQLYRVSEQVLWSRPGPALSSPRRQEQGSRSAHEAAARRPRLHRGRLCRTASPPRSMSVAKMEADVEYIIGRANYIELVNKCYGLDPARRFLHHGDKSKVRDLRTRLLRDGRVFTADVYAGQPALRAA